MCQFKYNCPVEIADFLLSQRGFLFFYYKLVFVISLNELHIFTLLYLEIKTFCRTSKADNTSFG